MLYDAVIFDLDGTLSDSWLGIVNCVRYALDKMHRAIPDAQTLDLFIGPPLMVSFKRHCGMSDEEAALATKYYRERYVPIGWAENTVYPGVRALLKELKESGAYLAVATGKPESTSLKILKAFGLIDYFDAVAGPDDGYHNVEKADLIARVLPKGKHAVMIGDTAGDVIGANAQGIDSIAIMSGYGDKLSIADAHPTRTVKDIAELTALLCPGIKKRRGFFISFEGIDGCGKTTQLHKVMPRLTQAGFNARATREPGGCPISEAVRAILLPKEDNGMEGITEALLFAAARAQHVRQVIAPAVADGDIVLCDRFVDASIAYQGGGRQLGEALVAQINAPAVGDCLPDATVFLRIPVEEAMRRRAKGDLDRIEQQKADFFARTEAAYERLAKDNPERYMVFDGTLPPDKLTDDIYDALLRAMLRRGVA